MDYNYPIQKPLPKFAIKAIDRKKVVQDYEANYGEFREYMSKKKRPADGGPVTPAFNADVLHALMATYENYRFGELSCDELHGEYDKAFSVFSNPDDRRDWLVPIAEHKVDTAIYNNLPFLKSIILMRQELQGIRVSYSVVNGFDLKGSHTQPRKSR